MLDQLETSLFENTGYRLKRVALVWFAIEFVVAIVSAVISFFALLFQMDDYGAMFLLVPVGLGVAIGAAWLSALPLYAFGELLETNYEIEKNTRPEKPEGNMFAEAKKTAAKKPAAAPIPSAPEQANYLSGSTKQATEVEHLIYCPSCGLKNKVGSKKCWSCDSPLG